jgi:hypothetical protein
MACLRQERNWEPFSPRAELGFHRAEGRGATQSDHDVRARGLGAGAIGGPGLAFIPYFARPSVRYWVVLSPVRTIA